MPRGRIIAKRTILPDPKFSSELLAKFINCIMLHGKKSVAKKIVYGALDKVSKQLKALPKSTDSSGDSLEASSGDIGDCVEPSTEAVVAIFDQALDNIRPAVEVRARRVGGATYQIPREISPLRQTALAMRLLKNAIKQRSEKTMALRLAAEIMDAYHNKGLAVKRREDIHRMAKANQAYAYFLWT